MKWVFPSSFGIFNHGATLGGTRPLLLLHERAWEPICTSQDAMAATKCWDLGKHDWVKYPEVVSTHRVSVQTLRSTEGQQLEQPQPQNTKAGCQGFCIQDCNVSSTPLETVPTSWATNCLFAYICSQDREVKTGNWRWLSWWNHTQSSEHQKWTFVGWGSWSSCRRFCRRTGEGKRGHLVCASAGRAHKKSEELAFLPFAHCPLFFLFQCRMYGLHSFTPFDNPHILPSKWAGSPLRAWNYRIERTCGPQFCALYFYR